MSGWWPRPDVQKLASSLNSGFTNSFATLGRKPPMIFYILRMGNSQPSPSEVTGVFSCTSTEDVEYRFMNAMQHWVPGETMLWALYIQGQQCSVQYRFPLAWMQEQEKESRLRLLTPDDETKRKYVVNSSFIIELDEKNIPRRWKNKDYEWVTFTEDTRRRYRNGFIPVTGNVISYEKFIKGVVSGEIEI